MANSSYTRVLVHLRRASQETPYTCAKFSECILDALGLSGEGLVECLLQDNKLLLQSPPESSVSTADENTKPSLYKLMHPPFCPIQNLDDEGRDNLPPEIAGRGVDVGVAALLESSDHKLLLTHRAEHMRTFPNVWVPPGGHVENGESLEDAALRELEEETGLMVNEEERKSSHILGLWESVFPPLLNIDSPKRHHIVVYLHITLTKTSEQLNKEFKLCPEEVDAAAWLSAELIKLVVWGKNDADVYKADEYNELIPVTLVNKDGEHVEGTVKSSFLTRKQDLQQFTFNRITTGSRYALSLWLKEHFEEVGDSDAFQQHLYGQFMQVDNTNPIKKSKI